MIHVLVKPNSSKGPLVERTDVGLTVFLREKAVDGAANKALIEVISREFKVPKTKVLIVRGANSRHKVVEVID